MSKELSLRQRIHNAAGSQAVENCHARHAYYHAKAFSAEEWEAFGQALGASVQITFTFPDGTVVGKQ